MNNCPRLESARLILRPHGLHDLDDGLVLWTDPIVVRHTLGRPSSRQDVWSRILRYAGHWSLLGFGYWAVEEKTSGRFIGELGFADFKREIEPSIEGLPELGWALLPAYHGQGYATEALSLVLAWADANLSATKMVAIINPDNYPSLRVAEKIGFHELLRTTYLTKTTLLYERLMVPKS